MSLDQQDQVTWVEDEDYVTYRPYGPNYFRKAAIILLCVLLAWFAYRTVRNWFDSQLNPPGEQGAVVEVIVPEGATTGDIARQLEAAAVIPDATMFRYYTEYKDVGTFQAGQYVMRENSSADQAIEVLLAGPIPQEYARFTVPPGLWTSEIVQSIANQLDNVTVTDLNLALASGEIETRYRPDGATSWEGLLFPDTYEVGDDDDAVAILSRMSDEFTSVTGGLGYGAAETRLDLSAYDVLIIASLVEAEAKFDDERPLVASVIYNRLREQWPLGIDATCVYGQGVRGVELTREILDTMSEELNPYDCRTRVGLPPTPVGAPGEASLKAAIEPAETDFMYYVLTDPAGRHTFVETDEEFREAVASCQAQNLC